MSVAEMKELEALLERARAERDEAREMHKHDTDLLKRLRKGLEECRTERDQARAELKEDAGVIAVWRGRAQRAEKTLSTQKAEVIAILSEIQGDRGGRHTMEAFDFAIAAVKALP